MSEEDRERKEQEASAYRLIEERRAKRRAQRGQMRTSEDAPVVRGTVELPVMPPRPEPKVPAPGESKIGFSGTFVGQTDALRDQVHAQVSRPSGEVELGEADLGAEAVPVDQVVEAEVPPAAPSPPPSPIEGEGGSPTLPSPPVGEGKGEGAPDRYIWTEEDRARVEAERATQEAVPQAVPHPELSDEVREEAAVHMDSAIAHLNEVADEMAAEPQKPVLEIVQPQPEPMPEPVTQPLDTQPSPIVPVGPFVLVAPIAAGGMLVGMPVQDHEAHLAELEREEEEKRVRLAREREEQVEAETLKRVAAMRDRWAANEAERQAARDAEAKGRSLQAQRLAKEIDLYNAALTRPIDEMLTSEHTQAALVLARRDHKDGKDFRSAAMSRLGSQRNALWVIALLLLVMVIMQFATFRRVGNLAGGASQANPALQQELTALRGEITKLGGRLPDGWKMECRLAHLVKDGEETYVYQGCSPVPTE